MPKTDFHTRMIGWLKVALPLAGLALLSTLFLFNTRINPEDAIPLAGVDVADRLREPRMTGASYSATTEDGAALTLNADEARTPGAGDGSAKVVTGSLQGPRGEITDIAAGALQIDADMRQIALSGGVTITSSNGWQVESRDMTAAMDETDIATQSLIRATGPAGQVTAGEMRLKADPAKPDRHLLVFNGAVKLIYQPE